MTHTVAFKSRTRSIGSSLRSQTRAPMIPRVSSAI